MLLHVGRGHTAGVYVHLQADESPGGGGRQGRWQGQLRRGGLHSDVHLLLWGPAAPGCLQTKLQ